MEMVMVVIEKKADINKMEFAGIKTKQSLNGYTGNKSNGGVSIAGSNKEAEKGTR